MEGVSRDSTLSYLLLKALHEDRSVTVYWMKWFPTTSRTTQQQQVTTQHLLLLLFGFISWLRKRLSSNQLNRFFTDFDFFKIYFYLVSNFLMQASLLFFSYKIAREGLIISLIKKKSNRVSCKINSSNLYNCISAVSLLGTMDEEGREGSFPILSSLPIWVDRLACCILSFPRQQSN